MAGKHFLNWIYTPFGLIGDQKNQVTSSTVVSTYNEELFIMEVCLTVELNVGVLIFS